MDFNLIAGWIVGYGVRIVTALLILLIGWWLARLVSRLLRRGLGRADIDPGVASFTGHLVYWAVLLFAALAALSRLGIETTSMIAVLGAAGLAVGLALQGALSNFAVRPFVKVEDYWSVWFEVTEQVKLRFDQEGISIPFPQQDVHLFQAA